MPRVKTGFDTSMQNLVNDAPVKRNYDFIDYIRCLAMMSIVAEHAFDVGAYIFKSYSVNFWVYVMDIQLTKFGTIAFFILAGFLLGDKFTQYTPSQYLQRRVKSTFWPWVMWSLVFFAGLLIRDWVSYRHYGSGGFDFWQYFRDELMLTYLFSNYWFIINFLICIAILLLFRKKLYSLKLGGALLACTLFYCVNVYFEWIIPIHTTALFGFVFFLWLGAQFNKNLEVIESKIKQIPFVFFLGLVVVCFALAMAETRLMFNIKSQEPFNTLRITIVCYSLAAFALLVKIGDSLKFLRFFRPRETTFGIYLIHAIMVFLILPEIQRHFNMGPTVGLPVAELIALQFARFITAYILTFIVVISINQTSARWIIGNSIVPAKWFKKA